MNYQHNEEGRISERIAQALIPGREKGLGLQQLTQALGEKGFGLILTILSLPSALPIPAPGYSTLFGLCIALIAWQMVMGRQKIWLPTRMRRFTLSAEFCNKMLAGNAHLLKRIERVAVPRWEFVYTSAFFKASLACVALVMAVLMMLPVPLTNTLPAVVIFLLGVGISSRDGLAAIVAAFIAATTLVLYAYLFIVGQSLTASVFAAVAA